MTVPAAIMITNERAPSAPTLLLKQAWHSWVADLHVWTGTAARVMTAELRNRGRPVSER